MGQTPGFAQQRQLTASKTPEVYGFAGLLGSSGRFDFERRPGVVLMENIIVLVKATPVGSIEGLTWVICSVR